MGLFIMFIGLVIISGGIIINLNGRIEQLEKEKKESYNE